MPTVPAPRTPSYRFHKRSGQAVVTLAGKDIYLGKYRTAESRQNYDRVVAEYLAAGRKLPVAEDTGFTINQLIERWDTHARQHYRDPDGKISNEFDTYRYAIKPFRRLYGNSQAEEFGPMQLQAVRQEMIQLGWARPTVNAQINRIRRVFRWAASQQLVGPTVVAGLETVAGLQRGRTEAPETKPVKPVDEHHARTIKAFVASPVAAMIELQLLTGMRPGEVVIMRACDLDTTGDVWEYVPERHKNQHRDHARIIPLGPKAQAVIEPFLTLNPQEYLFRPSDAVAEVRQRRHEARKTPGHYGNTIGSNRTRKPSVQAGERYDVASYRRAIERGCERAFPLPPELAAAKGESQRVWWDRLSDEQREAVKAWHKQHRFAPNQQRHTFGTKVRKTYRLEGAQAVLGHKHADVTQVYSEVNFDLARRIAAEVG